MKGDVPNNSDGKDLLANEGSFDKIPDVFNEDVYSSIENLCIGCLGNHLEPSDSLSSCIYLVCNNASDERNTLYSKNLTKTDGIQQLQGSIISIDKNKSAEPSKGKIKNKVKWLPYGKVTARKSTKIHKEKVESKGKGLQSLEAVKKSSKTAGKYAGWSKAVNGKSHEVKTPPCTKVVRKSRRFSGSSSPVWSSNELNASTPVKRRHEGSLAENGGCISVPHSSPGRVSPNLEIFEKQGSKVSRKTLIPCVDLNSSGWITSVNYSNAYKDGRNDQKISIISSEETIENAASVKEVEPATSIKYSKPYDSGRKRPVDGTTHNFSSLSKEYETKDSLSKEYETKDSLSKEYETKDSHQSEPPSGVIQFFAAGFMERSRASENIFHDITLSEETVDKNLTEPFTVNRHLKGACVSGQRNVVNYKALVNSVEDPVENHCSKVTALNRVSICSKTFSRVDTPGVSTAARGIERTQDKYPMLDSYKGNNIDKETSFIISHNCPSNLAAEFPENPDIESLSSKGICSCSMTSSCKSLENVLTPVSWLHTMSKRATEFYASKLENLPGHTIGKNEKEKSELINAKSNDLAFGEKGKIFDSILIGQQPVTCPESTSPEFVNVMDECGSMHLDNDLSTVTAFQLSDYCLNDGDNEYGKINSSSAMNVVSGKYKQNKFKTNNFPLLQDAVSSANFPVISEKEDSEVISVKGNNFDINEKEISGSLLISQQPRSFKESMDLMDECRSIHTDIDSSTLTVCDEFNVHYGTDDDYGYGNNSSSDMSMVSVNYKQNEGKTDNFPLQDTVPSANFPVISDKEESEVISVKGNNFVIGEKEISGSLLTSQQPHSSKESVDLMDECGSVHTDSVCSTLTACNEFSHYGTDDNNECGKISSSSAMNVVSVNCKQNEPKTNHGVTWSSYGTDHAGVSMGKNNSVKLSKGAWAPLRNENSSRGCKGAVSSRIRRGPCIYRMFEYPPDQKILFNAIGLCCNVEQLVINRFQHNQDFLRILGRGSPDLGETLDHQKHYPWRILSYHAIKSRSRGIIEDSSTLKTTLSPYKLKEVSVRLVDIAKSIPQLLSKKASIRVKFRKKQEVDREFIPNLNSPVVFHGDHLYCKQSDIDMNTKKLQLLDTSGRKIMVSIIKTSKINTHENKKEGTHVTGVGSTLPHLNKDCFSKMSNSINPEREKSSCQIIDENNQTNRKCMSSKGSQPTTSVIHKISVTTNKDLNKRFESTFLHNYSSYGRNLRKMNEIPYRSQRPKLPSDQTHRVVHHVDTTLDGITQNRKGVMMINKENENTLPNTHRSNMNISMNTDTWNKNCTTIRSDLKDNSLLEKYPEENSPDKDSQEENSTGNRKSREFQSENSMGGRQSWKENIVKVRDSQEENFLIPRDSQENMDEIYSNEKNWVLNESCDENCMVEKDFQDGNGMIEREVHQDKSAVGSNSCENNVQKDIVEKGSQDDKLPLKRGSQNNSFAGDCHLKMPPEFLIMRGKKASPLKHSSKLQENDPASKCCLENKNKSKVGARGDIFCLNASSHTKSVPISSHIVNFCSKPQAIGTCSELEIFSICSEPQVVGTHSEPQIIGTHSEPQIVGTHSEPQIFGTHSEPQIVGTHSEPQIIGTHSEPQVVGTCSEAHVVGTHSEPQIIGTLCEPQITGTHSEPQVVGTCSEAQGLPGKNRFYVDNLIDMKEKCVEDIDTAGCVSVNCVNKTLGACSDSLINFEGSTESGRRQVTSDPCSANVDHKNAFNTDIGEFIDTEVLPNSGCNHHTNMLNSSHVGHVNNNRDKCSSGLPSAEDLSKLKSDHFANGEKCLTDIRNSVILNKTGYIQENMTGESDNFKSVGDLPEKCSNMANHAFLSSISTGMENGKLVTFDKVFSQADVSELSHKNSNEFTNSFSVANNSSENNKSCNQERIKPNSETKEGSGASPYSLMTFASVCDGGFPDVTKDSCAQVSSRHIESVHDIHGKRKRKFLNPVVRLERIPYFKSKVTSSLNNEGAKRDSICLNAEFQTGSLQDVSGLEKNDPGNFAQKFAINNYLCKCCILKREKANSGTKKFRGEKTDVSTKKSSGEMTDDSTKKSRGEKSDDSTKESRDEKTDDSRKKSRSEKSDDSTKESRDEKTDDSRKKSRGKKSDGSTKKSRDEKTDDFTKKSRDEKTDDFTKKSRGEKTDNSTKMSRGEKTDDSTMKSRDEKTGDSRKKSRDEKTDDSRKKSRGAKSDGSVMSFKSSCEFPGVPAMLVKNNLGKNAEYLDKIRKFIDPVVSLTRIKIPKSGDTINLKASTNSKYRSQLPKQKPETAVTCSTKLGKTNNNYSKAMQNCPCASGVNDCSSQNSVVSSVCPENNSSTCAAGEETSVLDSCLSSSNVLTRSVYTNEKNGRQSSVDKPTNQDNDSSKYRCSQLINTEKNLKDARKSIILSKSECSKKFHPCKSGITASHEGAVDYKRTSQGWNESRGKRLKLEDKVQGMLLCEEKANIVRRKNGDLYDKADVLESDYAVFPSELRNSAISSSLSKDFVVEQSQDSSKVSNKDKASHGNIKICSVNKRSKFRTDWRGKIIDAACQPYVCIHRTNFKTARNFLCSRCEKIFCHKTRFIYHKKFLCKGRDPKHFYGCRICSAVLKNSELRTRKSSMVKNQYNIADQKASSSRNFLVDVLKQVRYMFKCEGRAGLRETSRFKSNGDSVSITKLLRAAKYITPHYLKIYGKRKFLEPKDLSCRTEKTGSYPVSANSKHDVTGSITSNSKSVLPREQVKEYLQVMRTQNNTSSCSLASVTENNDSSDVHGRGSLRGSQLHGREIHDAGDLACRNEKTDSYPISANSKERDEAVSLTSNAKRVLSGEQVKELQVMRKNKDSSDVQERGNVSDSAAEVTSVLPEVDSGDNINALLLPILNISALRESKSTATCDAHTSDSKTDFGKKKYLDQEKLPSRKENNNVVTGSLISNSQAKSKLPEHSCDSVLPRIESVYSINVPDLSVGCGMSEDDNSLLPVTKSTGFWIPVLPVKEGTVTYGVTDIQNYAILFKPNTNNICEISKTSSSVLENNISSVKSDSIEIKEEQDIFIKEETLAVEIVKYENHLPIPIIKYEVSESPIKKRVLSRKDKKSSKKVFGKKASRARDMKKKSLTYHKRSRVSSRIIANKMMNESEGLHTIRELRSSGKSSINKGLAKQCKQ